MKVLSMFDLAGRSAVVTGGCSGLGLTFAEALAEAGADIVLGDIIANTPKGAEAVEKIKSIGVRCLAVQSDVSKEADCQALIDTAVREYGKIDILVNNAGIAGDGKRVVDLSLDMWEKVMAVNLRSAFLCSRAAAKYMIAQKEGKIINISSASSFKAVSGLAAYASTKAGMIMLTKTLAVELGRFNIQVNALAPGYLLTELNRAHFESEAGKKQVEGFSGMKRLGTPEELKGLIVMLASKASSFVTGAVIVADGGQWL
ncbi:MAG: SDR family oxidoreductase [Dehalococcoidia bacterium]|nr:SDR family oxidoreductase [Dehalococcoidia bacterium]